jgi:hypothetical protein
MEANGVEACFVGTSITGGNYTGLRIRYPVDDQCVKSLDRSQCENSVILDGDTGHGGIMAIRRFVRGVLKPVLRVWARRPAVGKRRTMSASISSTSAPKRYSLSRSGGRKG